MRRSCQPPHPTPPPTPPKKRLRRARRPALSKASALARKYARLLCLAAARLTPREERRKSL
eukprot:1023206-Alexandrium_andersonii.AAC.1